MEKSLQKLTLTDRRKLEVGGVLEIISYDDENITMYTALGNLRIGGENLEVGTAFSENGTVEITGYIRTIHFCDGRYADNFISRILGRWVYERRNIADVADCLLLRLRSIAGGLI